jgi:hypothetical protein
MEEIEIIEKRIKNLKNREDNIDAVVSRYMKIKRKKMLRKLTHIPKKIFTNTYKTFTFK